MTNEWTLRAACRTADPNIFFPETYSTEAVKRARTFCDPCPVHMECLAEHDNEEFGIWAGTIPADRLIPLDDIQWGTAACCGAPIEVQPSSKYYARHRGGHSGYDRSEPCRWALAAHVQQTRINKQRPLFADADQNASTFEGEKGASNG